MRISFSNAEQMEYFFSGGTKNGKYIRCKNRMF